LSQALHEIKPIKITLPSGEIQDFPSYLLTSKLPYIKRFLELIMSDWLKESTPKQKQMDIASQKGEPIFELTESFMSLEPIFLKCLFSFAFFFTSIDTVYIGIHRMINWINSDPKRRIRLTKPPKKPLELEKLIKVRHWCIAHLGDVKAAKIDTLSSLYWTPLAISKESSQSWDLNRMSFGTMKIRGKNADGTITESTDLELENIPKLYEIASKYLSDFDQVCVDNIEELRKIY
jgi:hypothetical protein